MINLKIGTAIFKNIELIIFDKDGTLFQLYPYWSRMAYLRGECIWRALAVSEEGLAQWISLLMGVDLAGKRMNPNGPIGIQSRAHIQSMLKEKLGEKGYFADEETIRSAFREADVRISHEDILRETHVPVAGMIDFLESIKGKCKCAMLSHDTTSKLELCVRSLELSSSFQMILGGDRTAIAKPHPWGAKEIMAKLGVSPENTAFMGDSIFDMECGRNAGCGHIIAVLSEISDVKKMESLADISAKDFRDIIVLK